MTADLALSFDPQAQRIDLAIAAGNLAIDRTPVSAMLLSLLCDRRARIDDDYQAPADPAHPPLLDPRRGWWADFLDPTQRRLGSRLWLLRRAKQTEATRRLAESAAAEGLADLERDRGLPMTVAARWTARGRLGLLASAGAAQVSVAVGVG
jgi:phage gp46-like protein